MLDDEGKLPGYGTISELRKETYDEIRKIYFENQTNLARDRRINEEATAKALDEEEGLRKKGFRMKRSLERLH